MKLQDANDFVDTTNTRHGQNQEKVKKISDYGMEKITTEKKQQIQRLQYFLFVSFEKKKELLKLHTFVTKHALSLKAILKNAELLAFPAYQFFDASNKTEGNFIDWLFERETVKRRFVGKSWSQKCLIFGKNSNL